MGKSLLVLRIACLDVVIGDGVEKVLLLLGQLAVESTAVGQPLVVMGVGRVVRLSAAPVGLQSFLYGLVAHEGNIEPTLCLIQVFGHAKGTLHETLYSLADSSLVGYIKPVCYFVCCHVAVVLFVITTAKIRNFLEIIAIPLEKLTNRHEKGRESHFAAGVKSFFFSHSRTGRS